MGGKRWDTSSLFARQEACAKGHVMDRYTNGHRAKHAPGAGAPIITAICAMALLDAARSILEEESLCGAQPCAPLPGVPVSATRRHTGTFPITKRCWSSWRWKVSRNCVKTSRRRRCVAGRGSRPHRQYRRRLYAVRCPRPALRESDVRSAAAQSRLVSRSWARWRTPSAMRSERRCTTLRSVLRFGPRSMGLPC